MINLTLNQLKRPALSNLVPKFGTKVEKNDINKGGLSTEEVDRNVTLPFELMREVEVSSSDTTTKIQYDAKIAIVGSDPVTLTLDKASYKGCVITITNRSTEQATIVLSEDNQKNLESKKSLVLEWDGTVWNDTALVVDSTVSENSNKPVSSAAVYQKATEITEAYTQAIAGETTARSEAITTVEQKVTEETSARTQADTALGTRIDEEVEARTNADTNFTQQIEAIERLHATLIGPGDFVDTDSDTVTVNDSNKSIRQIAHEEFYRQLITDADNVQSQIDTLKELADYLQTNPSVIADMYNKLGVTWSVDNLTDFGTFDFSRVLTATNVDDAVLELYNTFTGKIGELTSLATSAKDNIVVAVNELKTKIDEEVTARTDADTGLSTRIDEEVAARTEADTQLGTRIDTEVGTLSALTTIAKDNVVAAINEVNDKVGTGGDTGSTASNCEQFTFVVDSNDKLTQWANNDRTSGQDYTSVLIKKGEWTTTTGVDLSIFTGTSTKVVVGEAESELVFSNTEKGLYYDTPPNNPEYYMLGVTVKSTKALSSNLTYCYAFHNCSNLTNCIGVGTANSTGDAKSYGFFNCSNLTNCEGRGYSEGRGNVQGYGFANCGILTNCYGTSACTSTFTGSGYGFYSCTDIVGCRGVGVGGGEGERAGSGYGFSECSYLSNCTGTGSGNGMSAGSGYSFVNCDNLTNCRGTIVGVPKGYVFRNCSNLMNCTGKITISGPEDSDCFYTCSNLLNCTGTSKVNGSGIARCFRDCSVLTNCIGSGTSAGGSGFGFVNSENLTNCQGTGTTKGQSVGIVGYGFYNCDYTILSKAGGRSTTSVFSACYALGPNNGACDASVNGGFNNPTNPPEQ